MSLAELAQWGTLVSVVIAAFALGAAPVFTVRCLARIYPKGHPRRAELVAEMSHVRGLRKTLELWRWLGEEFATAICDGLPARWAAHRVPEPVQQPAAHLVVEIKPAYKHTNSKGITYFLRQTEVTLRGGNPQTIYFFANTERNTKGGPTELPADRCIEENPRNGFLTISQRK